MLAHDDGILYGLIVAEQPQGEMHWCHASPTFTPRTPSPRPPPYLSLWKADRAQRTSNFMWQPLDEKDCFLVGPLDDFRILESRVGAELLRKVPRNQRLEVIENRQYQMALNMDRGCRVAILLKSLKDMRTIGDPMRELKIGIVDQVENGMVHIKLVTNRASISTPYPLNKIREDPMHPLLPPPKELYNLLEDPTFCQEHQLNINDRLVYFEGENRLIRGTLLWAGQLPPSKQVEVLLATDIYMGLPHHNFHKYYRLMKVNPDYVLRVPVEETIKESALEENSDGLNVAPHSLNNFYAKTKASEPPISSIGLNVAPLSVEVPRKPPVDSSEDDSSEEEVNDPYYQAAAPVVSPHHVNAEAPDSPLNIYRACKVSPQHLSGVINSVERNNQMSPSTALPPPSNDREEKRTSPRGPPELPRSPPLNSNSHHPISADFPPAVPARPSDFGVAFTIDPNGNRELRAGETVQLLAEPRVKGSVRWFGEDRIHRFRVIGIELFKPHPKGNSGLFDGLQRFHTQPQQALFVPTSEVVRVTVPNEPRNGATPSPVSKEQNLSMQIIPDVTGNVRPIRERDFRQLVGRNRGIQGDWNSCYLDSILFSLFTFSSAVDSVLFRGRETNDIEEFEKVQTCLKEGIVNPLRSQYYVQASKVMELRKILGQLTLKKDMCYSQKDIEELFGILMENTLKVEPLIRLSSGEKTNMYQIFLESKVGIPVVPETQTLLELSLACSNIKFLEEPSLLLMLMPRFSAEDQLFQMIIPSTEIELSNCIAGYPHKCCNCNSRADRECPDCLYDIDNVPSMESTFQCTECFQKLHEFDKTHTPRTYTVSDEFRRMHNPQPMRLLLIAVICIRHSHYVSFVRAGDCVTSPWVFFDSMFERKEGSHYTPCVCEVNVNAWIDAARKAVEVDRSTPDFHLTSFVDTSEVDFAERLFHDAYMCVYQSPNASIYK